MTSTDSTPSIRLIFCSSFSVLPLLSSMTKMMLSAFNPNAIGSILILNSCELQNLTISFFALTSKLDKSMLGFCGIILKVITTLAILIWAFKVARCTSIFCSYIPAMIASYNFNLCTARAHKPCRANCIRNPFFARAAYCMFFCHSLWDKILI